MAWVLLLHCILFLFYWGTNLSFKNDVNGFLGGILGARLDYLLVFILFSLLVLAWAGVRLALRENARKAGPKGLFTGIAIFYLVFFYGTFIVLFLKNPVQLARIAQMLQYFRIFVDAAVLLLAAWGLRRLWSKLTRRSTQIGLAALLALLWLVPVFWTPGSVYHGSIPAKPLLVAHRGASMLAPENTMAAFRRAADLGVYAVETDIDITSDGQLFLMHDSTLDRTTNVANIFPERAGDPAESFTWDELSRLSAGAWFASQDPYRSIARDLIDDESADSYWTEPIPLFSDLLQLVKDRNLYLIYDLRTPPYSKPFSEDAFYMCLQEIANSGAASHTWVLASQLQIIDLRRLLPDAIPAAGLDYQHAPSPAKLAGLGYRVVNSEYGLSNRQIHAYRQAGLWVNLWTVDEPWQYSRLWLVGADSVTSNNVQTLLKMSRPLMALPYWLYMLVWAVVGLLAGALLFLRRK